MKIDIFAFLKKMTIFLAIIKRFKHIFFFLCALLFFISNNCYSQNNKNSNPNNIEIIENLLSEAQTYQDINLDSSIILGTMAYQNALKFELPKYQYKAARMIADTWYFKDSMSKAIDYYKISAELIRELEGEDTENYASRLSDIGYCFYELEVNELAVNYYQEALNIFKGTNNIEEISNQLNNKDKNDIWFESQGFECRIPN